jgi:hypothetical protein
MYLLSSVVVQSKGAEWALRRRRPARRRRYNEELYNIDVMMRVMGVGGNAEGWREAKKEVLCSTYVQYKYKNVLYCTCTYSYLVQVHTPTVLQY